MDLVGGLSSGHGLSPYSVALSLALLLSVGPSAVAKRTFLLDTTQLSYLQWHTHSSGDGSLNGWSEESFANVEEGNNWRAYTVCDFNKESTNWLFIPYIPRGNANRLYIEITFTMRECRNLDNAGATCKEAFSLLYREADEELLLDESHFAVENSSFRLLDRVTSNVGHSKLGAAGRRHSLNHKNVVVRSIPVTKAGVYFAFQDEGSCTSLLSTKVYYEVCEETLANFAWFDETPAGPELASITETIGRCVKNAKYTSPTTPPKYICKVDGTWDLLSGGCQCNAGFEANGSQCSPCQPNHYKDSFDSNQCKPCPKHSESRESGSALCQCNAGFYRAPHDSYSMPCTRPPSKPENAQVDVVDHSSVTIVWDKPSSQGGRSELWYRVECRDCPPSAVYSPQPDRCLTSSMTISGLEPSTLYTVFIYAENDISAQVKGLPMRAVVEVTTSPLAPVVLENLHIESVAATEVTLSWDFPRSVGEDYESAMDIHSPSNSINPNGVHNHRLLRVHYYVLKYFAKGRPSTSHSTINNIQKPPASVRGLLPDTEYGFKVRASTSRGWSEWSETKWHRTGSPVTSSNSVLSGDSSTTTYLYVAIGVLVLVVSVLLVLAHRRRLPLNLCIDKKHPSDLDVLDYKSDNFASDYNTIDAYGGRCELAACPLPAPRIFSSPYAVSAAVLPKPKYTASLKPYVDPYAYEDPKQALRDFTNEIESENIIVDEIIGEGEFGEVCRGKLRVSAMHAELVAIKTLKPGSSSKARLDFLAEASIMGQFDHSNVVKLKGVVTRTEPVMIVTEYLENGSLDRFLKAVRERLDLMQLVGMLRDVACGMQYLSDKGFIHRDLAARNVLVDAMICCKISDFGLSRVPTDSDEQAYTTKGGKIPVRWTAPEAIAYRKFTSASDIWSFGVVMWEVMSYGERPYWDWTNQEVIHNVEKGYRLPSPSNCPVALYRLMMNCWNRERLRRPTFHSLLNTLSNFLLCPDAMFASSAYSIQ